MLEAPAKTEVRAGPSEGGGPEQGYPRNGQQISVRTTRHWDFVGQLNGDEIRGKMILRDLTGAAESEHDAVWRRE